MVKLGGLILHMFPHRAWPYPRGEGEERHVILVSLLIIFVVLVGIITGLKYEGEKTLDSHDLYFAAKNMTSYSSEAYLVATKSQQQPLIEPYRKVYIQQLASDVSEIKDKLATHELREDIQPRAVRLMSLCDQLHDILDTFSRQSDDHTFAVRADRLKYIATQAKAIEDSL